MTFWHLSFFNSKYLLAPSEAGLISNLAPANSKSTVGGGDSPSYSGFFHCLVVFDDRSSLFLTWVVYCCVCGINNPSTSLLSHLRDYLFANTLTPKLISRSSPLVFYTKHYQIPPLLNKINYPMFHFLDPLCLFT